MLEALSDYMRLARAGAVMLRNDVVIPDDYRSRMPWIARFAGGILRILPGGGGKGRPGQRFARALEKLGAIREGVLRRHMVVRDGFVRDSVYYGITDADWPGVKQRLQERLAAGV